MDNNKYYLLNRFIPIISNCSSINSVKRSLILHYGYNVESLKEITYKEYLKKLDNLSKFHNSIKCDMLRF